MALAFIALAGACGPADAQGSRIESFFDNAARFLEQQSRAIERGVNQRAASPARHARRAPKDPPMPLPNPRRKAAVAEASSPQPPPERRPAATSDKKKNPEELRQAEGTDEGDPPAPPEKHAEAERQQREVPLPTRNPAPDEKKKQEAEKPKTPPHPSEIASEDWSEKKVAAARAECARTLSDVTASFEIADPLREGICGAPAPIRLSAVNAEPRVEIRPPAVLTCSMAAELARWLDKTVQPAARTHLGEEIVAIRNAASYSCRNRYNAPGTRISEHALANALDISTFETASGKSVTLVKHWYATEKKKKEKQEAVSPAKQAKEQPGEDAPKTDKAPAPTQKKPTTSPSPTARIIPATDSGGRPLPPMPDPKPEPPETVPAPEALFLHAAFDGACKIFGTVLGPEANAAHRNHFHLDMKERSRGGYCE